MKVTLLTYGSRGDIQPFVALAKGLQSAGHRVKLAAPHRFEDFVTDYEVPFVPLAGDPEELSSHLNDARSNVLRMVKNMSDYVRSIATDVARAAFSACDDAELIVHSFLFTTGAHSLARMRGIPDVSIQTFPVFTPTQAFPMVAMAKIPGGKLSYLSHWLATKIFWQVGNAGYRQLRKQSPDVFNLELDWPWRNINPNQTPLIYAYSPHVLPRPADWNAQYIHIPGYFFLDTIAGYQPPQSLADFLAEGEPPVCVTFGSMVNQEAERIQRLVLQSLRTDRQRVVLLSGWGRELVSDTDDSVFNINSAPHDWLFPRCKAVIHHGGAGTTGAVFRAGIPQLIIPHGMDQLFWGKQVAYSGAGTLPIEIDKLSETILVAAIHQFELPKMRLQAQRIGEEIHGEDGVGQAVQIIERYAADFKPIQQVNYKFI